MHQFKPIPCAETAGFLFEHACANQSEGACAQCGKHVCKDHLHSALCTTCAKQQRRGRQVADVYEDDDVYFYSDIFYNSYGPSPGAARDPNDFTEADGESLQNEGGEGPGGFERDMSAS